MVIDRRRFLALAAAAGLAPGVVQAAQQQALYLAARRSAGRYEAVVLDARGRDLQIVPMPARGHSFALDPARGRAVVFGRQPGFFAVAFRLDGAEPPMPLQAAQGRHFFGHGVFLPDGQRMVATENHYEAGYGVLGVYDTSPGGNFRRIGEFETGGIGPHEAVLLNDGRTVCVANGGILTHPDYGKLELNLDTMRPSLAYVDAQDGRLLEQVELPAEYHRLSIRHLAVAADGAVWFGCQHTGPASERPPLVGRHRRGRSPELFAGPSEVLRGFRNYVGSVAVDPAGRVLATSSPVGGQVVYWDTDGGRCLGMTRLADGCGVAPLAEGRFLVNSGLGALVRAGPGLPGDAVLPPSASISWDNHFRKV